jgi:hypothetical protein
VAERLKNAANNLLVFPQTGGLGRSALHPLVVECVHGANLRFSVLGALLPFTKLLFEEVFRQ